MKLTQYLLALRLTKGLGKVAESKIVAAIQQRYAPTEYPWSLDTLAHIVEFPPDSQAFGYLLDDYSAGLAAAEAYSGDYFSYFDAVYPANLREIYQPPLVVFYAGQLDALQLPRLSVVGTRTATPYGLAVVRQLLPPLIQKGVAMVSGLAKGIDVMAHQITFGAGGVPIAVVGTGVDVAYPQANRSLQAQIAHQGLILSEYPLGTPPRRAHFPDRNRIIAGLSAATLVVEAKQHSGSLITANLALQNNRQVLAVPGSIFAEESQGTNALIFAGALPVTTANDIMEAID